MLVEINENWNGDVETLQWLTWLSGYDNVRLEKGSATVDVIREVTKMPDLRSLILADAEVSTESLEVLATILDSTRWNSNTASLLSHTVI